MRPRPILQIAIHSGRSAATTFLILFAPIAFGQATSVEELEFWRSAERISTESAYAAYLAQYSSGVFAPLAKAALEKLRQSAAPSPPRPQSPDIRGAATYRSKLAAFSAAPSTGAVSFRIGDKFYGPGVLTVGRLGAKKQILLPNGEWVVLAAVDYKSTHARPIDLTSIAFGQFDVTRLHSLLAVVVNRWPSAEAGNTWTGAINCESDTAGKFWHQTVPKFPVRSCMHVGPIPPDRLEREMPSALWQALQQNLGRLESEMPKLAFNLMSSLYVTNNRASYLHMKRLDCVGPSSSRSECNAASATLPANAAQSRIAWAQTYFPLATDSFSRNLAADDLAPSVENGTRTVILPD